MSSSFRATSPEDREAIAAFFRDVWPDGNLWLNDPETMAWKYWAPHPFWDGSRSYVLERDGAIMAHGAVLPASCVLGTNRFRAFHLIDWAAAPAAQGAGVSLFRRMMEQADAAYVVGGSPMTQRILPALGFRELGVATHFVRPLRPLAVFAHGTNKWRGAARAARALWWRTSAPSARSSGWTSVPGSGAEIAGIAWRRASPQSAVLQLERTAESIAWFLKSPAARFRLYTSRRGYFLLVFADRQVRIADAWVDSENGSDWRDLYLAAVAAAAGDPKAIEVTTTASNPRARAALADAGFHARGADPIRFLARRSLSHFSDGITGLDFQPIDSDASFLGANQLGANQPELIS